MERFIIIAPHTNAECIEALQQMLFTGYLTHFDWGCKDGDHTGWAIIEAENAKEALMVVPPSQRQTARAVHLTKFLGEEVEKMHHK